MRIVMHGHHADSLFSLLDSLEDRIEFIKTKKPEEERALRLALIQDVTDLLPQNEARAAYEQALAAYWQARAAYEQALAVYWQAWAAYEQARAAYWQAWAAFGQAWAAFKQSFDTAAFHAAHCHPNCPWDGQTIFSKGTGIEVLSN